MAMNIMAKNEIKEVWPQKRPSDVTLEVGEVLQATEGNVTHISQMPIPTLEKVESLNNEKDKVIIICPGGGYSILAIDLEGTEIAAWLQQLGYTTYILRYRVPNNRDGALQDAQRAIRWVRAQHPDKKIGIMGFSAGASLSARMATRYNVESYKAVDQIDTISSRPDFAALIYPAYMDLGENRTLTPELTVSNNTPPMFVFQTADDEFGNSSLVITQALRDCKVPVELHYYPKGGHGYGLRKGHEAAELWPVLMEKWLETIK